VLGDPRDPVTVLGLRKPPLSPAKYRLVKALLGAGEAGLSKDELDKQGKCTEGRKYLRELADSDRDWKAVLVFPGKSWGRYRILSANPH
jgi:hypothetical protein